MPEPMADVVIGEIRKNAREDLRVVLQEFRGHPLCALRVWTVTDDGKTIPTKSGLNVRVGMLDDLIELLVKARDEARARGLVR